jgi:queuosine precursor transporter
MNATPHQRLYLGLVTLFVTTLLVADITAGKFFSLGHLEVSVGVIPFPIAFLITDIVNEYYGRQGARWLTVFGVVALCVAYVLLVLARALPAGAHSPVPQGAFDAVFGISYRFFGASLLAYTVGQLTDIYAFHWYKRLTRSRHLWLRATGSTAISQVVDTTVVNAGALIGVLAPAAIVEVTIWSYLYKMAVAVALTPACYAAHRIITRRLGIEPAPVEEKLATGPYAGP